MCRRKHTGRRDIGASQREGDRPALRAAAPTQRGLSSLQPSARTSWREGVPLSPFYFGLQVGKIIERRVLAALHSSSTAVSGGMEHEEQKDPVA